LNPAGLVEWKGENLKKGAAKKTAPSYSMFVSEAGLTCTNALQKYRAWV